MIRTADSFHTGEEKKKRMERKNGKGISSVNWQNTRAQDIPEQYP
jgi:hypothetical protein